MAAAAKAKVETREKAAGIPRGRLVAQSALAAFVFGGTWVIVAVHIAEVSGPCIAVEGPVWGDARCRHLMTYPLAVALVSLLLMLALCIREARAESEVRKAGGGAQVYPFLPEVGFAVGPESRHLRGSNVMAHGAMITIYLGCVVAIVVGIVVRYAGSRRQLRHPADAGAATLAEYGSDVVLAGCLALWIEYCCLVVPYLLLRLRRFVRANWVVSLA